VTCWSRPAGVHAAWCGVSGPLIRCTDSSLEPPSEQAHVPAEQPPPREDPRFPATDAHSCWSRDSGRPSKEGPSGPLGLTSPGIRTTVLPAASRLRQRPDFSAAVRSGHRAGRPRLVVHLALAELPAAGPASSAPVDRMAVDRMARVGFVVNRTVGGAVMRNRVRRQLRHLVAARLWQLPQGARVVVRALPAAAGSTSAELASDLDAALTRCLGRISPAPVREVTR
jgi:ribonuclease P protein component